MMNVVSIDPKNKHNEQQKKYLLEVVEEMRRQIEAGQIKEFVACSIDVDSDCQIHVCSLDLPGSVGLFEIGKHLLIQSELQE